MKPRLAAHAGNTEARITFNAEYNPLIPSRTGIALEEAWIRYSLAAGSVSFSLNLGRQFVSWGAADSLILTAVVCPQNLTAYAGLDFILAGLDWNPGSWTITAQYYEDLLPGARGGRGIERDRQKNGATLSVSRSFFSGTLSASASCYLGLKDFDTAAGADLK
ncbi:MAG: hypothetical protein LBP60_08675 [Spirochaetaceae bacterium]|jgi:hypothetical protein|nr:hypothetical protein [Spirochaetaceae bacterium]